MFAKKNIIEKVGCYDENFIYSQDYKLAYDLINSGYKLKIMRDILYNDKKNIGIWINHKSRIKKIAAIGIKIKKWIAYHGFAINYSVNLNNFKKIIPCGVKDKGLINILQLKEIEKNKFIKILIKNFIKYLNNLS